MNWISVQGRGQDDSEEAYEDFYSPHRASEGKPDDWEADYEPSPWHGGPRYDDDVGYDEWLKYSYSYEVSAVLTCQSIGRVGLPADPSGRHRPASTTRRRTTTPALTHTFTPQTSTSGDTQTAGSVHSSPLGFSCTATLTFPRPAVRPRAPPPASLLSPHESARQGTLRAFPPSRPGAQRSQLTRSLSLPFQYRNKKHGKNGE